MRWISLPTLMLLIASPLVAGPWEDLIDAGTAQYEAGELAAAESTFVAALAMVERYGDTDHRVATTLTDLAEVLRVQGRFDEAAPLLERALAIQTRVLGPRHREVATTENNLGAVRRAQGHYAEAESLYSASLDIRLEVFGDDSPEAAQVYSNLSTLYTIQGRVDEAEAMQAAALRIREGGAARPDQLATSLVNLAVIQRTRGNDRVAAELYGRAIATVEARYPDHPRLAWAHEQLGDLLREQGNPEQAAVHYNEAIRIRRVAGLSDHPEATDDHVSLGAAYREQNLPQRAIDVLQEVLPEMIDRHGDGSVEVAEVQLALASAYLSAGRYGEAGAEAYQAALGFRRTAGPEDVRVARAHSVAGDAKLHLADYDDAVSHYEDAMTIFDGLGMTRSAEAARIREQLAIINLQHGDLATARHYFERALEEKREALGEQDLGVAVALTNLGVVHLRSEDYPEAQQVFEEALVIRRMSDPPDLPGQIENLAQLAMVMSRRGERRRAEGFADQALWVMQEMVDARDPRAADAFVTLGSRLLEDGIQTGHAFRDVESIDLALDFLSRALDLERTLYGPHSAQPVDTMVLHAMALAARGRTTQAVRTLEQAVELCERYLDPGHPRAATCYRQLGLVKEREGRTLAAEEAHRQALRIRLDALPPGHRLLLQSYVDLIRVLRRAGRTDEAREYVRILRRVSEERPSAIRLEIDSDGDDGSESERDDATDDES